MGGGYIFKLLKILVLKEFYVLLKLIFFRKKSSSSRVGIYQRLGNFTLEKIGNNKRDKYFEFSYSCYLLHPPAHTHRKSTAHLGIYTLMFQNVKKEYCPSS